MLITMNGRKGDEDGENINDDDDDDDDDDVRNDDDLKNIYSKLTSVYETQINTLPIVQQLTSNQ